MKKERLFAFDFIRAIATISIVLIHFNAIYLYMNPPRLEPMIISSNFGNIYLGAWGVSLFFVLSGASLMYVYQDKINIKTFFKKRFLALFPMFYIAYIIVFFLLFYQYKMFFFRGVPKINFLLTIIGMDGTLSSIMPTFYLVGEWFLGCIILIYIVFPIFRKLVINKPRLGVVFISLIFIYMVFFYKGKLQSNVIFLTRLPEFCFGMYFMKYIKKSSLCITIISFAVILLDIIFKPSIPNDIQVTYYGIASFLILMFIADYFKKRVIVDICNFLSKYSYAIFLVHHQIIVYVTSTFDLANISIGNSLLLFVVCLVLSLMAAVILYRIERITMGKIRSYLKCE